MRLVLALAVLLTFETCTALLFGSRQRVIIKGRLKCGDQPANNVVVKLVDEDTGPDPDDTMARGRTDAEGAFSLDGSETEISSIDPWLKIYHDCNDGLIPCQRKWKWKVPKKYINSRSGNKEIDIGTWNLEVVPKAEERDCIHK